MSEETEENFSPEISQSEDIINKDNNLVTNDQTEEQTKNDSDEKVSPDSSSSNETNGEIDDVLYDENQDNSISSVVEDQESKNKVNKKYKCDSCAKIFKHIFSVQQHLKYEHKDNPTTTYSEVQTKDINESGAEFEVNSLNNQFHENFPKNDLIKCQLCGVTFTEEGNRCQGLENKYRYHVYSKHLKRKFEDTYPIMFSDKLCFLGDCKSRSFPDEMGLIKHLIGKKHGILEQFMNEELLLQDKTTTPENLGKFELKEKISKETVVENFEVDNEIKEKIPKESVVENFEVDDEIMPHSSPTKSLSNLESFQENSLAAADNLVKKCDEEEYISRKKCELCDKTFDKSQPSIVRRKHLYFNHFRERIDKEINWEPTGKICPKGNTISKYGKFLYVLKFWAQLFTSLKADLRQDINGGFAFLKKVLR